MSEFFIPLPANVEDRLQEGCRGCWYARNLLSEAIKADLDPIVEAQRINEECGDATWRGEENPQESLINGEEGPALAMSTSLRENCSHPLS